MSRPQPRATPAGTKAPARAPVKAPARAPAKAPAKAPVKAAPSRAPIKARAPVANNKPASTVSRAPARAPSAPAEPKATNWINRTVQGRIAGVGSYAGNLVYGVGNGVNAVGDGIGQAIANTTRYWGQGVAGYGNNMKDAVGVGGPRVSTAGNPLGLAGQGGAQGQLGRKAQPAVRSTGGSSAGGGFF